MISAVGWVLRNTKTAILTMGASSVGKLTGKEFTTGLTQMNIMMASGRRDKETDMEFGRTSKVILTLGNGSMERPTGMASTLGAQATNMRANGKIV